MKTFILATTLMILGVTSFDSSIVEPTGAMTPGGCLYAGPCYGDL